MVTQSKITFQPGTVLNDRWIVMELVGKGGMGEVYRVHQMNLKRDIALKIISLNFLEDIQDDEYEFETSLERFRREVEVMAQIRHPNVLQVFDHGKISFSKGEETIPVDYITTEFIPGDTLRSTMSDEGFSNDDDRMKKWIKTYFLPVLKGVQALNDQGIVHRDLKPENILMDGKIPKIADFGLARSTRLKAVTQSMDLKGTPPYMSPEHFMDLKRTDQRTDIYAMGKILYEAAEGKMTAQQIPFQKANLKNPETLFFQRLNNIIETATALDKEQRYASAETFRQALKDAIYQNGDAPVAIQKSLQKMFSLRRKLIGAIVAVFIVLSATGTLLVYNKISVPKVFQQLIRHDGHKKASGTPGNPELNIQGADHAILFLVNGGKYETTASGWTKAGQIVQIPSFYMDETMVTNYQFVDFLNQVLPQISVKNGVVFNGKEIWLFLGEIVKGLEPIVYQDGKFQIHGTQHAACPVLRVTGAGASAYAGFFSRRLPTAAEWSYVALKGTIPGAGDDNKTIPKDSAKENEHRQHQITFDSRNDTLMASFPEPVMLSEPNRYGIRGLNENIKEWVVQGSEYEVMGGILRGDESEKNNSASALRSPWEAFPDVGFRTVMNVSVSNK